jgi:Collagen triple helix repeat (20 copies)
MQRYGIVRKQGGLVWKIHAFANFLFLPMTLSNFGIHTTNGISGTALLLSLTLALSGCGGGSSDSGQVSTVGNAPSAVYQVAATAVTTGCANGGIVVYSGIDVNKNGVLDAGEITSSQTVCNGSNGVGTLVNSVVEPAGNNCQYGGTKVTAGPDSNGNSVLDAVEVTSTAYICHGSTGATGAAGTNGSNGTNGLSSLMSIVTEPSGGNCSAAGKKITTGLDSNGNGVLDAGEVTGTAYVCNGAAGAAGATGMQGVQGLQGLQGATGAQGVNGSNGTNGLNSLMSVVLESAGAHCAAGGNKVTTGQDANNNGVLDAGEVSGTAYICNGATGATGASGTNGTNGTNGVNGAAGANGVTTLVAIVSEPNGSNCVFGGSKVTSGLDSNSNGGLDAGEVSSTSYVCNGATGATGPQGPAGPGITWVNVTGTSVQAVSNVGYLANNAGLVVITLPATPLIGDIIQIDGIGIGGWIVVGNPSQSISTRNISSVSQSTVISGRQYDTLTLQYAGNGVYSVLSYIGPTPANVGTQTPVHLTSNSVQAASNTFYLVDNSTQVAIRLPIAPSIGDSIQISGIGTGGWKVYTNPNQSIASQAVSSISQANIFEGGQHESLLLQYAGNNVYTVVSYIGQTPAKISAPYIYISSTGSINGNTQVSPPRAFAIASLQQYTFTGAVDACSNYSGPGGGWALSEGYPLSWIAANGLSTVNSALDAWNLSSWLNPVSWSSQQDNSMFPFDYHLMETIPYGTPAYFIVNPATGMHYTEMHLDSRYYAICTHF